MTVNNRILKKKRDYQILFQALNRIYGDNKVQPFDQTQVMQFVKDGYAKRYGTAEQTDQYFAQIWRYVKDKLHVGPINGHHWYRAPYTQFEFEIAKANYEWNHRDEGLKFDPQVVLETPISAKQVRTVLSEKMHEDFDQESRIVYW